MIPIIIQRNFFKGVLWFALLLFLHSCAIQSAPTGGDKDVEPPKVIRQFPANESTHFIANKVEIRFDEFIVLNNVQQEVIISPEPEPMPMISAKGKSIIIDFSKTMLMQNTTYSILFGSAIRDLNEGNILQDFSYVFSTGEILDSLKISGKVLEALTLKPLEKFKVMLYTESDSFLYQRRPNYYTRTAQNGSFQLTNLRAGNYHLLALEDKNNNYILDGNEKAGLEKSINVSDSFTESIRILAFPFVPDTIKWQKITVGDGVINAKLTRASEKVSLNKLPGISYVRYLNHRDSVVIWHNSNDSLEIVLNAESVVNKVDTAITITKPTERKKPMGVSFDTDKQRINQYKALLIFVFSEPVISVDLSKIKILNGEQNLKLSEAFFTDSSKLFYVMNYPFEDDQVAYNVRVDSGAFVNLFGQVNDSIRTVLNIQDKRKLGDLTVNVAVNNTSPQWIFQLINSNGNVFYTEILSNSKEIHIPYIEPGDFTMLLIKDKNGNGRWDAGNVFSDRKAEEVFYHPDVITLKANWEITGINFDIEKAAK